MLHFQILYYLKLLVLLAKNDKLEEGNTGYQ